MSKDLLIAVYLISVGESVIGVKYPTFTWFDKTCVESSWKALQAGIF